MPPNDVELRAAYCLGRLDVKPPNPDDFPLIMQQGVRHTNDEVADAYVRLQSYLVPKYQYLDAGALVAAINVGRRARDKTAASSRQCFNGQNSTSCAADSEDIRSCREAKFLPF